MKNEYTRIKRSELDKLKHIKYISEREKPNFEAKIYMLENEVKELKEELDVLNEIKTPTIWDILKSKLRNTVRLAVKRVS